MIQELQLRILPEQAANEQNIAAYVAREQGIDIRTVKSVRVLKRSIDARQRTVMVNLKVRLYINEFPQDDEFPRIDYGDVSGKPQAVVVGAGPAGLFAALRLIELGCALSWSSGERTCTTVARILPASVASSASTPSRTTVSARVGQVPSPTASSTPAARSGAT